MQGVGGGGARFKALTTIYFDDTAMHNCSGQPTNVVRASNFRTEQGMVRVLRVLHENAVSLGPDNLQIAIAIFTATP